MLEKLQQILNELDAVIEYTELLDHGYTKFYLSLIRKRKAIKRAIRAFEKEERRISK